LGESQLFQGVTHPTVALQRTILPARSHSDGKFAGDALLLVLQAPWHALAVAVQVLADAVEFCPPAGAVEAEEHAARFVAEGDPAKVEILLARQVADRRFHRIGLALRALDHPLEHAQVVAEARPQELAVAALAEPVDVEDLRQL